METKSLKFLRKISEYLVYLTVFLLPWQTKIIIRPAETNFNEIGFYPSYLILLIAVVTFFIYQLKRRADDEKIGGLWLALSGLELAVLVSFLFAPDKFLAFYYYVILLISVAWLYVLRAGTTVYGYEETCLDKLKIFYSLLASLFLQSILGIYQFLNQKTPVFKYLGLAEHSPGLAGTAVIETASGRFLRAYGGFDHPNIFGGVLAISLIFIAYFLANRKRLKSDSEIVESIFLFIAYFVLLLALFFTMSRTAWLAFLIGLIVLLVTYIIKRDRWFVGRLLLVMFFSAIMIFVNAVPYQDLLSARVSGQTRLETQSLFERREYAAQSLVLIKNNWLTGVGIGNYVTAIATVDNFKKSAWQYQPVHNVFLLLWAQSGLFSLLFFIGALFFIIKRSQNTYVPAIFLALLVLMVFDHWLISLPFGALFLFLVLGLL